MQALLNHFGVALNYTREFIIVALILARTMPMMFLTPFLAGKMAPSTVKMGFGVLLTVLLWPLARAQVTHIPTSAPIVLLLMMKEVFIGLCIGFVNAEMFYAMDMSGRLIDTVRGTSMSEVQDPSSKQRVTPVGDLYSLLFLVVFVVLGGHFIFLRMYFYSFKALPIDKMISAGPHFNQFVWYIVRLTAQILVISVGLAAPVVAATFISDVVFGILNRVAPQLNAYFMSMPVKALGGVIMIFIALDAIVARFGDYVTWTLKAVQTSLHLLAG